MMVARERQAVSRERRRHQLAIDVADAIREAPDSALRRALAALPPSALGKLQETLAEALLGRL